jgi:hypothetical protein
MKDRRRALNFAVFVATFSAAVVIGPEWRAWPTELTCTVRLSGQVSTQVFVDMTACGAARVRATADDKSYCVCSVRISYGALFYYFWLLPAAGLLAGWFASPLPFKVVARGIVAVLTVLVASYAFLWISALIVLVGASPWIVVWPRFTFFEGAVRRADGIQVFPNGSASIAALAFWTLWAVVFGMLTPRVQSFRSLLIWALLFVVVMSVLIAFLIQPLGWRMLIERPRVFI